MLTELKIENVAVIKKADIFFEDGLNILTGETGAGKSIVIDSINAVLGERTKKELVRDGEKGAKVTAFFEDISHNVRNALDELDIEQEDDGALLISRTVTADGRSSCKVNGQPVTVTMLKRLGRELITICGQHDSQKLLQSESHLGYIDALANCQGLLEEYRVLYRKMQSLKKELSALDINQAEKKNRLDYLEYQINELENADITVGEIENLKAEKAKIQNREMIMNSLYSCHSILAGDENTAGLADSLYSLSSFLAQLSDYQSEFLPYSESVTDFKYEMDECLSDISAKLEAVDESDVSIDSIEARLDVLYRLSKKYGSTEEEMLSYLEKAKEEYDSIAFSDEKKAALEAELASSEKEVFDLGCLISDHRKAAALRFEAQVSKELAFLDMPHARFSVDFKDREPYENGLDEVEFLFSANAGQEEKPLSKIASGGELSRVMLAVRCVLTGNTDEGTMIFDEIDTGVSGRAAHKIAAKLREVSFGKQVICVTHLAQIAAFAENHLLIEKQSDDFETVTKVKKLDGEDRIRELARIIGGDVITPATLKSAQELIDFSLTS